MATKRMFSNLVIDSDDFCELSLNAQLLYFHLGMKTDDDGFVTGAKRTAKLIGASADDFKELVDYGFLINFPDSNVYLVTHFRLNNEIKADRKANTIYQNELSQVELTDNKSYRVKDRFQDGTKLEPQRFQDGTTEEPQYSIDKDNIEEINGVKNNKVSENELDKIIINKGKDSNEREPNHQELDIIRQFAQQNGVKNLDKVVNLAIQYGVMPVHDAIEEWTGKQKQGEFSDYMKG